MKNCENCEHGIITGGDIVPYGATTTQLPDSIECDCPDIPEDDIDKYLGIDGEECPYHSWNEAKAIDDYIQQHWGTEDAEIIHRNRRNLRDDDIEGIHNLFLEYESEFK